MNKIIITSALLVWMGAIGAAFADDVSTEMLKQRNFYQKGAYQSAVKQGLYVIDLFYPKLGDKVLAALPELSNFTWLDTNVSYNLSLENGNYDFGLTAQKVYSNQSLVLQLSADTSPLSVERYFSLLKTYEYLSDKGSFQKVIFTNKNVEVQYLLDKTTAVLPYAFELQEEQVLSGILFRFTPVYLTNLSLSNKLKLMDTSIRDFVSKFKPRDISPYLK